MLYHTFYSIHSMLNIIVYPEIVHGLFCVEETCPLYIDKCIYIYIYISIWGFPKIMGTLLGVPIIRVIVFWGLYWGPLILGNYYMYIHTLETASCFSSARL